jgi:DNA/RNA-binding protein KIN17
MRLLQLLETVLPAIGGTVMVVNGDHRGCLARLDAIHVDAFNADATLLNGRRAGTRMHAVPYEHICKYAGDR